MNYNVGDTVRVKSLDWYNNQKDKNGDVNCGESTFFASSMSKFCGSILTIKHIDVDLEAYKVEENDYYWSDEMFEELAKNVIQPVVFENIVFPNENYADKVELCLGDDYEIVVEDGRTFVQRKKLKYPTTYEVCCDVLGVTYDYPDIRGVSSKEYCLYSSFIQLIRCRDAYWHRLNVGARPTDLKLKKISSKMQMKKYYDLFNLIYFNMKTIKTIINKLFSAKPEQSPSKEYYFRVYRWMAKQGFLKGGNDENKLY